MTFEDFLKQNNIPYKTIDEDLYVCDKQLRENFPDFQYKWEYLRHNYPPNSSTSENKD